LNDAVEQASVELIEAAMAVITARQHLRRLEDLENEACWKLVTLREHRRELGEKPPRAPHEPDAVAPDATTALGVTLCSTCGEKLRLVDGAWQHFGVGAPYETFKVQGSGVAAPRMGPDF
jgi:hypothetical protein